MVETFRLWIYGKLHRLLGRITRNFIGQESLFDSHPSRLRPGRLFQDIILSISRDKM